MDLNPTHISKKEIYLIITLFLLILALPLTIFLVRQRQDIRPKALVSGGPAKLFLTAPDAPETIAPGETVDFDIYLDKGGKIVSGVEAHLLFPVSLVEVDNIATNTTDFPTLIQARVQENKIDIAVGVALP